MAEQWPDLSQVGFLGAFDRALGILATRPPYLGGSIPSPMRPGDRAERIQPTVRAMVQLEDKLEYAISAVGERRDVILSPGDCLYLAPNAWSIEFWNQIGWVFGFSLLQHTVRLIHLVHPEGAQAGLPASPFAYHTALPLGGAGQLAARSLNHLAEEGDPGGAAHDLFAGLLRLCRQHLLEDNPGQPSHRRAQHTWRAARMYMEEHFNQPISREVVGDVLKLHPNYLSTLARQVTGQSFREVLESIRMQHGQRLLRDTDLKLHRIASLCGYSDAANFSKAFRRATGTTPGRFRKPQARSDGTS